jgi:hypothetical protein
MMKNRGFWPTCELCLLPLGAESHHHFVSLTFILSRAVPFRQYSDDVALLLCQLCPLLRRELAWASGTFSSAEAATLFRLLPPPAITRPEACKAGWTWTTALGRILVGGSDRRVCHPSRLPLAGLLSASDGGWPLGRCS